MIGVLLVGFFVLMLKVDKIVVVIMSMIIKQIKSRKGWGILLLIFLIQLQSFLDWEDDGMDDIFMGIFWLLCLCCCCYFKGDGVMFFGIGQ